MSCAPTLDRLLVLILAIAVVAAGKVLEVCKEGCEELPEGRSCSDEHDEYPTKAQTVEDIDDQQPSCEMCTDCPDPTHIDISLELSTELRHYSSVNFSIAVTWAIPENVTGFTLILTDRSTNKCHDIIQTTGPNAEYHNQCISQISPDTQQFNFTYLYKHDNDDSHVRPELFIKLTAHLQHGCATAEKSVAVPRNCHTLHPGVCKLCGEQPDFRRVPKVSDVTVTQLQGTDEGTWQASVSWNTSSPCERCIFYLTFGQQPNRTTLLKVVGRTNVTLHNLMVQETYSVQVRPYQCECGRLSPMEGFPLVNATTTVPLTTNMALVSASIPMETAAAHLTTLPVPSSPLNPTFTSPVDHAVTSAPSNPVDHAMTSTPSNPVDYAVTSAPSNPVDHAVTSAPSNPVDHAMTSAPSNPVDYAVTSAPSNPVDTSKEMLSSPTQLTPSPVVVTTGQFMALYPIVGVGVAMVIAVTVLAGVLVQRYATICKAPHPGPPDDSLNPVQPPHPRPPDDKVTSCDDIFTIQVEPIIFPPTPPPTPPPNNTVLLVYSSATPEDQNYSTLWLLKQLRETYGIKVHCSQVRGDRARLVEWVPRMARDCGTVVCVCNEQFYEEWEGAAYNGSPVHFLKEVVNGIVSAKESETKLCKYAVVYIHQKYIPDYLLSCERYYLRSKTTAEMIARFVCQVPEYQL